MNPILQSYMEYLRSEVQARAQAVVSYRQYADGDQKTALNDDQITQLGYNPRYRLNICQQILNAKCDRLTVTGLVVRTPDDTVGLSDDLTGLLWGWWEQSRLDAQQNDVHFCASRDADTFVIVDYDAVRGRPRITHNLAYDGESGVRIHYEDSEPVFASKRWHIDPLNPHQPDIYRLNLYYPNRVEKYYSEGTGGYREAGWRPFTGDGDAQQEVTDRDGNTYSAAVAWLTTTGAPDGEPLGLPVVHFRNNATGDDYGRSDIDDLIPSQDAINNAGVSLIMASTLNGFKVRWATGVIQDSSSFRSSPGGLMSTPAESARIGEFSETNLLQLIETQEQHKRNAALVSGTPLSYLNATGQIAAEGTLQQQEAPLLAKVQRAQQNFGNAWEDAARLMLVFESVYGEAVSLTLDDIHALRISAEWATAETRNDRNDAETLALHRQMGVPLEVIWAKLGYSNAEIEEMQRKREQSVQASQGRLALSLLGADGAGAVQADIPDGA